MVVTVIDNACALPSPTATAEAMAMAVQLWPSPAHQQAIQA